MYNQTLSVIADILIKTVDGATNGLGSKYEMSFVKYLIPELRAQAIVLDYNGSRTRAASKKLTGDCAQGFTIPIVASAQVAGVEYLLATCPRPVRVKDGVTGIIYAGSSLVPQNFSQLYNRNEVGIYRERNMLGANSRSIAYFHNGTQLEIYGNKALTSVDMIEICADPTEVSGFNQDTDTYPISMDLIPLMAELFVQNVGRYTMQKAGDEIFDQAETDERRAIKSNLIP